MSLGRVWRFGPIEPGAQIRCEIPYVHAPRHVGILNGKIHVWCEVNPTAVRSSIDFGVWGTGWDVPPDWSYLGSVIQDALVWHVFTRPTPLDLTAR